ncbi:MAG: hypothetical protein JJ895_02250 [Balneolaceae bacterium]|nr:hypothetical protein [Balneolaceae bacterium]
MNKLILIPLIIFSINNTLLACSCGEWEFQNTVDIAEEIFIGRLIKIELDSYPFTDDFSDGVYTFEISKKWKGSSSNRILIYDSDGCFPTLHPFSEYIIYAYKDESQFEEVIRTKTDLHEYFDTSLLPGYRFTTMYCMRIKDVAWYLEKAPFRDEIARLDSTFTSPITLRPHYLNFKNIFFLSLIGFSVIWIWKRRTLDSSAVTSQ